MAFFSAARNLVPGDDNGAFDVFVRDRVARKTERVSVGTAGRQANGDSFDVTISEDGHAVAFNSAATNLVPDDTNGVSDVFVHER